MTLNEYEMELRFKGDRNYLHGTDIMDEALGWLLEQRSEVKDIDFAFHRLATHQLNLILGSVAKGTEAVAVCNYVCNGMRESAYLVETGRIVVDRYAFPEKEIVDPMEINVAERRGVLYGETSYRDIEVWVAMTKALHLKALPHLRGKWLFVRGRFPQYVCRSRAKKRELVIAASFNDKLTRTEAWGDDTKVGEIYFSIV